MVDSDGSRQGQTLPSSPTDSGAMESLGQILHRVGDRSRPAMESLRPQLDRYLRLNHRGLVESLVTSPSVRDFVLQMETVMAPREWQCLIQYIEGEIDQADPEIRHRRWLRDQIEGPLDLDGERARAILPPLPGRLKRLDTFLKRSKYPVVSRAEEATRAWLQGNLPVLTLVGPPGTGKTHLAEGAVAYLVAKGLHVAYFTEPHLIEFLRRGIQDNSVGLRMDAVSMIDWLVLDDLGMPGWGDWDRGKIDELVNRRWTEGLKTLVTTNLLAKDLPPRIASRLSDRERAVVISINAADYRVHGR